MNINNMNQQQNNTIEQQSFGGYNQQNAYQQARYVKPSNLTGLKIAIIVGIILCLMCCCCVSGLFFIGMKSKDTSSNPDGVIEDVFKDFQTSSACNSMEEFIQIAKKEGYEVYSTDLTASFNSITMPDGYGYIDFYYYDPSIYEDTYVQEQFYIDTQEYINGSNCHEKINGEVYNRTYEYSGIYYNVGKYRNSIIVGRTYDASYVDQLDSIMKSFGY